MARIPLIAAVALLSQTVRAAPEPSGPIVAIDFEGGTAVGFGPAEAEEAIDLRVGDNFTPQSVRRAIKLLYHTGLFGQVRARLERTGKGLRLVFQLQPKKRSRRVEFIGNEAVDTAELERLCRMPRGEEIDHNRVAACVATAIELYRERGYRKVQVVPRLTEVKGSDLEVRFFIQEGPPTRIAAVELRGQPGLRPRELLSVLALAPGETIHRRALEEALKRLRSFYFDRGYLEASVRGPACIEERCLPERAAGGSVVVPIEIESGPRVEIRFRGNEVLSAREFRRALPIKGGTALEGFALADLVRALKELYQRLGYASASVKANVSTAPDGKTKQIEFQTNEGPRVQVRSVNFVGNRTFTNSELRALITAAVAAVIAPSALSKVDPGDVDPLGGAPGRKRRVVIRPMSAFLDVDPAALYLPQAYQAGLRAIADLYRSRGFQRTEVGQPLLAYGRRGTELEITIPIEEGPETKIKAISFKGNQAKKSEELSALNEHLERGVRAGQPFDPSGAEAFRREIVRAYNGAGYAFCRVEQEVTLSKDATLVELEYRIGEGPKVRVGRLIVRGALATDRRIFTSLVSLRPGQVYSPGEVETSRRKLQALGVFSSVDIKLLDPETVEPVKHVVVYVRERYSHQLDVSPGVSSAEGLRLQAEYTHRNLFGAAIEAVARAKVSYQMFAPLLRQKSLRERYAQMGFLEGLEWRITSGLHWPRFWWTSTDIGGRIDLVGLRDHARSYELTKVSAVPGLDFRWTEQLSQALDLDLEYIDLNCPYQDEACNGGLHCGIARRRPFCGPTGQRYDEGKLLLLTLRQELSWDLRDSPFDPHKGSLIFLRLELASTPSLSPEASFVKTVGQISGYIPLGSFGTLALSARAGAIFHLVSDSRTPSHKLFFLGGRNSMRGFDEDNFIPADLNPPCIARVTEGQRECVSPGGNAFLLFKAELRFPLWGQLLSGAAFVDFGNLWLDPANLNPLSLRPTTGIGLRFGTPIGPVAFDLGFNPSPDERRAEPSFSLHFNVGVF